MADEPATLFDPPIRPEDAHDPGGKSTFALPAGMTGGARFSDCGRYRHLLWRSWGDRAGKAYALWIGMNPSTARADVNDPTINRETGFTERLLGIRWYFKCNIADYRATNPKALLADGVVPRSSANLGCIRDIASDADCIIMAYGSLHKKLRPYAYDTVDILRADGRALWCLGRTKDRSPRHPLYLPNNAELERFG